MDKKATKFLQTLLTTPSPSGHEWTIQRTWLDFVKKFADDVQTDIMGNGIGVLHPDAPFKVVLAGHCDEIGFIINDIDDRGYLSFSKVGGISPKIAPGMRMNVLGFNGPITGVVGARAEHHGGLEDEIKFEQLYIDCGATSKEEMEEHVQIGDFAVYHRDPSFLLNDRISARGLDNRTGAFIVAEVLRRLAKKRPSPNVGVYAVSTVSEEIGLHGAYAAGAGIQPDMALVCDVTFATDHPGVDPKKHGKCKLDGGPVLAKGSPINPIINKRLEASAKALKMSLQYELTPSSTGTDGDRIRFTGAGVPIALVSLPIRYMHSPVETASLKDLDEEIKLICHMLRQLEGDEDLRPITP
ncbi:MAG: M42 family peptidase [Deltaproteobacteria bacterium]|nr:MAG: M42 family peptidase [Deltaproteobacteria bacterium]